MNDSYSNRFYNLLKKVQDSYERGLSCAIEQNHEYKSQIRNLQQQLLAARWMNRYFNETPSKRNKGPINSYEDLLNLLKNNSTSKKPHITFSARDKREPTKTKFSR